jgi:alginate O-acetyltransferase complex protein AlgI
VVSGLKMILWGFFQKLVVADRLSAYVNAVYKNPENHSGLTLLLATVFFAFQIYCDFAGYSNIALGSAKIMGFKLMTNFERPYYAKSVSEFWKRWHISLSSWFRDYLYIPLGGNRVSIPRWYFNLLFVFLLSGLWHGANWTFIVWGAINGLYLIFSLIFKKFIDKYAVFTGLNKYGAVCVFVQIVTVFLLTDFAWIFFRANSIDDAFLIIRKIFTFKGPLFIGTPAFMVYAFLAIVLLLISEFFSEFNPKLSLINNKYKPVRYIAYAGLITIILLVGVFDGGRFIYFQF